ncbi:unnamed protein product [Rhizopus stolonifer]
MLSDEHNLSILCDLQIAFKNAPFLDIKKIDAGSSFWLYGQAQPFKCCLKEATNLIQEKRTAPVVKYEAIRLRAGFLYPLICALSSAHELSSAKKAINELLAIYPTDVSEKLLKDIHEMEL